MDKVKSLGFIRRGSDQWGYNIETQSGKKYEVYYRFATNGHMQELLTQDKKIVYDREFRVGFRQKWTVEDFIENDGRIPTDA